VGAILITRFMMSNFIGSSIQQHEFAEHSIDEARSVAIHALADLRIDNRLPETGTKPINRLSNRSE
jgi:hypothetical protein